jgi:mono/diheme cytochrome c family protein
MLDEIRESRRSGASLCRLVPLVGMIFALAPSSVRGQPLMGDIAEGHRIAREVCAECHRVERGEIDSRPSSPASFKTVADKPSTTAVSLRVFLRTPHANMPNLRLSPSETEDIIGYILSLK